MLVIHNSVTLADPTNILTLNNHMVLADAQQAADNGAAAEHHAEHWQLS